MFSVFCFDNLFLLKHNIYGSHFWLGCNVFVFVNNNENSNHVNVLIISIGERRSLMIGYVRFEGMYIFI